MAPSLQNDGLIFDPRWIRRTSKRLHSVVVLLSARFGELGMSGFLRKGSCCSLQ